ncbi:MULTISPECIES: hypothetical protein [Sporosarcina]|uniref:hypothetical protein n=1 Tax=Sporosarcina TaxID=1569 RepID=UPI000694A74D|nr:MULTISPECIES: hypothetical protein [Sporosarcina]WJY27871.1 GNAT family N-acetyltransferase [Sporosarcina sp. 0.2-SM1T-5]
MKTVKLKDGTRLPVELLTINDLPDIKRLQEEVIGGLAEKAFLQPLTDEEFICILEGNGIIAGVRAGARLIAFRALLDPGEDPEHLGRDAGIPSDEWQSVLYSEITNVSPDYQGNGIQLQLGRIVLDTVDTDRFNYLCTTVSPFNIASLKDKLALGMHIASLTVKYGNLTRYVMLKYLAGELELADDDPVDLPMEDTQAQQEILGAGWIGTAIHEEGGTWMVRYHKERK